MVYLRAALAALAASAAVVVADIPKCGPSNPCPASAPCCSSYGQCGVGAYCLGGCNPQYSHDLKSCMPAPVCKSGDYKLSSLSDVEANTKYLGDSSDINWVSSGTPVVYNGDSLLLTMAQSTVGTLLSSAHYVWYGKISATMTTSQGAGVVTAFIMMSDVKDEIDFEFVGVDTEHAQSNFYFQGITDYDNEMNLSVSDTVQNTHTYTFDWQPDSLTWAIDGKVMRTLNRNETWNTTDNTYHYPQTPARIQLSLWPAGLPSNGQGTVDWAGGLIDWNSPYMQNGYYYAMVNEVTVDCYDPPAGVSQSGNQAYQYTNDAGTNNTVEIVNANTILASFEANGDNQSFNPDASHSTVASSTRGSHPSSNAPETVPGMSGGGSRGDDASEAQASAAESSAAGGGGSPSSTASGSSPGSSGGGNGGSGGGFSQGGGSSNEGARTVAGSVSALVAVLVVAVML